MRPAGEAAGAGRRCGRDGLTSGDDVGVRSPPGANGLTMVGHDGWAEMAIRPPSVV